jgi:predicted ATPase
VDDGNYYRPVNVGYGFSYVLSLITAVVLATDGSFIIVENPEAHLHPSAQAKMMNELIATAKERNIQLIVETHSDHVLNTALRAVNDHRLETEDLKVLFFSSPTSDDEVSESKVRNLEVNQLGHILNPPKQFFEQYSVDLRALYAPPTRHE